VWTPARSWLIAVKVLALVSCGRPVAAREAPFPAATNRVVLWSARSCYAEAAWSHDDCTALMHVIRKRSARSNWTYLRMLKAYSVKNWVQTQRGKTVLDLRLGSNIRRPSAWNQSWRLLVRHVWDVLDYRVEDPCPNADHWAAKYYQPKSPMRRVACDVETENAFWVTSRRP